MKTLAHACTVLVAAVSIVHAGPTESAIVAAMALSERPNYTWFSSVSDSKASYEIDGKSDGTGRTWIRMPMIQDVGRRMGREVESRLEAIFFGNDVSVVRVGEGWKTPAELPTHRDPATDSRPRTMVRGSANAGNFGIANGTPLGPAAPFLTDRRTSRGLIPASLGVARPHEELAIIVSSFATFAVVGDTATGTLSEVGAALLLVRPDQKDVEPVNAAGSFKLWLRQGKVVKYQLKLEGVVHAGGRRNVELHVDSITTIKDIGTTTIDVPEEAREKLGQ